MESILQKQEIAVRNNQASEYDSFYVNSRGYWYYAERDCVLKFLKLKRTDNILDAGSGTGLQAVHFSSRTAHITCIDFSERSIDVLNDKLKRMAISNIKTVVGDLTKLDLPKDSMDKAYSIGVIQHIPIHEERVKAVSNIYRVLKPGGVFVMVCYRWGGWMRPPKPKEEYMEQGLFRFGFTPQDAFRLFKEGGFNEIKVRGTMNIPKIIKKRLPNMLAFLDVFLSNFNFSTKLGQMLVIIGKK